MERRAIVSSKLSPQSRAPSLQSATAENLQSMSPKPAAIIGRGQRTSASVSAKTARGAAAGTVTFMPSTTTGATTEE